MDQQEARTAHFARRERSVAEVIAFNAGWDALEAEFAEHVRLAQEQAWERGWQAGYSNAIHRRPESPYSNVTDNPYTQGDKQA